MRVSLIVARATNGIIGANNRLPWHLPCDLKYFKRITLGKPVIMGRKTFESIGHPLPGRTNIVVTRNPDWRAPGVRIVLGLDDAFKLARAQAELATASEIVIIGGATLYRDGLPFVDRIYLTQVQVTPSGDASFAAPDTLDFERTSVETHQGSGKFPAHSYEIWDRIKD